MYSVWTPSRAPPAPNTVSGFSVEAHIVWEALIQADNRKQAAKKGFDPSSYYRSMYKQTFGGGCSQMFPSQSAQRYANLYHSSTQRPSMAEERNDTQALQRSTNVYLASSQLPSDAERQNNSDILFSQQLHSNVHCRRELSKDFNQVHQGSEHPTPDVEKAAHKISVKPSTVHSLNEVARPTELASQLDHVDVRQQVNQHQDMRLKEKASIEYEVQPSEVDQELTDEVVYSQSLFSQSQRPRRHASVQDVDPILPYSPPLEMEDDDVLSQMPRLPVAEDETYQRPQNIPIERCMKRKNDTAVSSSDKCDPNEIPLLQEVSTDHGLNGPSEGDHESHNVHSMRGTEEASDQQSFNIGKQSPIAKPHFQNTNKPTSKHLSKQIPHEKSLKQTTFASRLKTRKDSFELRREHLTDDKHVESEQDSSQMKRVKAKPTFQVPAKRSKLQNEDVPSSARIHSLAPTESVVNPVNIVVGQRKIETPLKSVTSKTSVGSDEYPQPVGKPFETEQQQLKDKATNQQSKMQKAHHLSEDGRARLDQQLMEAGEVALAIVYDDGSTQLREVLDTKKKHLKADPKPVSVAVAYPVTDKMATELRYVDFDLAFTKSKQKVSEDYIGWSKATLLALLCSKTKKLVFDAQEMIEILITKFSYDQRKVLLEVKVLDPKIAGWLLCPEKPPITFAQLLETIPEIIKPTTETHSSLQLCSDLTLLGPAMLHLYRQLKAKELWSLYTEIEMPLCSVLACMEQRGISVQTEAMLKSGEWLKKKLKKLEKSAFEAAGQTFLLSSHQQLRVVLFEKLRLDEKLPQKKRVARTASNQLKSTSEAVLSQLSAVHALPGLVLEYRQVQKLKSTYVDGLLPHVRDGQIYTHWDQTSAVTGRLTSTNPNLQAVPKQPLVLEGVRDSFIVDQQDEPVEVLAREPFVATPGFTFLAADFQQVELRLLAHLSGDPCLLAVFLDHDNQDIFVTLTAQWLGKPQSEVTTPEREQTKRVVYSVMYGAGKERLSEYLKISPDNAKAIMTSFLVKFPGINGFTRKCIAEAREKGYQTTIFRRCRWFPHINHKNSQLRAQAERQAVNFCVQGSAADLCKAAMLQTERALAKNTGLKARLLLQIHDELLLEVPDEEVKQVRELLRAIMEVPSGLCGSFLDLGVPLKVNFSQGKSWGHMTSDCGDPDTSAGTVIE